MFRNLVLLIFCFMVSAGSLRAAETLTHHGTFEDWDVFRLESKSLTMCYAASEALRYAPNDNGRERPILYIARYPGSTAGNTLEIRFGSDVSQFNSITAKLVARTKPARDNFAITVKSKAGFVAGTDDQAILIKSMIKGRMLLIESAPGTPDTLLDRYSLFGVTKAIRRLEAICPAPAPSAPPAAAANNAATKSEAGQ